MEIRKLQNLAISDNGFIFDPASGHSYTANETAVFVINNLKDGKSTEEIIDSLLEVYQVDKNTAEADLLGIVEQLTANYLV